VGRTRTPHARHTASHGSYEEGRRGPRRNEEEEEEEEVMFSSSPPPPLRRRLTAALFFAAGSSLGLRRQRRTFSQTLVVLAASMEVELKANGKTWSQPLGLFIGNEFVKSSDGRTLTTVNPS